MNLDWPLMRNNIQAEDLDNIVNFFCAGDGVPRLTNGSQVQEFERQFAKWLGCKYAVMVNSGASANLITMVAMAQFYGKGEVVVPCVTWSSDIMSVMHAGLTPVFADINPESLGIDSDKAMDATNENTRAVFTTHCLGFDSGIFTNDVPLIEDCCEAIGAVRHGRKLGTFGLASNFSFYYAHHMSTIEGGMVCTDDIAFYERCRMLRSHGMVREMSMASEFTKRDVELCYPDLHPEFIFTFPAFNVRSTEINAVIGMSQLKRLDANVAIRTIQLMAFLSLLDADKYRTDYRVEGSSNYALPLVLREKNHTLMQKVLHCLIERGVEVRRGTAGGGNQVRQPYLRHLNLNPAAFPEADHVHFYGLYIGNYPDLEPEKIVTLCQALNAL